VTVTQQTQNAIAAPRVFALCFAIMRSLRPRSGLTISVALGLGLGFSLMLTARAAQAQQKTYTLETEFDQGTLVNTLHEQATCPTCFPDKNLVILGRTFVSKAGAVWMDNNPEGWVVGVDATTGRQLVRLDSGLERVNGLLTGSAPSRTKCTFWIGSGYSAAGNQGNCPGRITTDANGDVWIANRGFNFQGTLSKFTTTKSHCIDRNNNGKIDSSADLNNDGIVDPDYVDPVTGEREYLGADEECILATIPVGGINGLPRAVAVDKKGKIWVGTFNERKVYRYNPNEPLTLESTINLASYGAAAAKAPYSAASGKNHIFFSAKPSTILRISIDAPHTVQAAVCAGGDTYGIVASPDGNEAWAGGHGNDGLRHATFPAVGDGTCETWPSNGRSITAVTLDTTPASQGGPFVWGTAYNNGGFILKYNKAGAIVGEYADGGATHGISVDFQNRLWVVSHEAPFVRVHSTDGTLATAANLGSFGFSMLPTTTAPGAYNYDPYLYSDFTGVQLDRQAPFTRVGTWSAITDGGAPGIPWKRVRWNEEAAGTQTGAEPEGTALTLSARAANTTAALATAAFVTVPNGKDGGADLTGISGRFIEVRADLTGPGYETPVLSDVTVEGPCVNGTGEGCCLSDADCNDGALCTLDTCPSPGGACVHNTKPNCCLTDAQCADTNQCTVDRCDASTNLCAHDAIADCCSSSADCEDGDLCTADLCSGPGGTCSFKAIQGCCLTDADCTKGNKCSNAKCPAAGALCLPSTQTDCCAADSDCADSDACTADKCDVQKKACSNDYIAGCCTADAQCNDNDPCTVDRCVGNLCSHDAKDGQNCCTQDSPSIGEPCDIPVAPANFPPCKSGKKVCKADGSFACEGAALPTTEICDGIDNDCDGVTDDDAKGCDSGFSCVNAACAKPCASGEFPCSGGLVCVKGFCVSGTANGGSGGAAGSGAGGGGNGGDGTAGGGGAASGGQAGTGGGVTGGQGGSGGVGLAGQAGASGIGAAGSGGSLGGAGGTSGTSGAAGNLGAAGADPVDNRFGLATGGDLACSAVPGSAERRSPAPLAFGLVAAAFVLARRARRGVQ
jgi:hypothetical protein